MIFNPRENASEPFFIIFSPASKAPGTTWIAGEGSSFEATLIFETETAGKRIVHHIIEGEAFDSETPITYTYKDGEGSYTDDRENTYEFTIDGGTLTAQGVWG